MDGSSDLGREHAPSQIFRCRGREVVGVLWVAACKVRPAGFVPTTTCAAGKGSGGNEQLGPQACLSLERVFVVHGCTWLQLLDVKGC